jgi:hypothetical protein
MQRIGWILLSLILLTACAAQKPTSPQWLTDYPQDTRADFISLGTGSSLELAKTNALENLANRLIVKVTSDSRTSNQKFIDGTVKQSFKSIATLQSESFNFIDSQVIKSHHQPNNTEPFAVLVQVNKQSVFTSLNRFLDETISPLLQASSVDVEENDHQLLHNGFKLWPHIPKALRYLDLLKSQNVGRPMLASRLGSFQAQFLSWIKQANMTFVVADTALNTQLNLKQKITQRYADLPTSVNNANNEVQIVVVGPTLQKFSEPPYFATKLTGEYLIILNGTMIAQTPIESFAFGENENAVLQQASRDFIDKLTLNAN